MAKKYEIVSPSDREQVLLVELNHRVKNSLQTVASVLRLQEQTVDQVCKLPLREAALRVSAIARVHGSLYRAAEVAITSTYLHDIMVDLQEILAMKLEEDITPVQLSVDMAVPLALFMTEAVTNAVKHNKLPETPRIKISFGPVGADRWYLSVADSGQGFPAEFKARFLDTTEKSFGMKLMKAFATQLEGDVTFFSSGGGIVRIEGPIKIKQVSNPVSRRKPVRRRAEKG